MLASSTQRPTSTRVLEAQLRDDTDVFRVTGNWSSVLCVPHIDICVVTDGAKETTEYEERH